MPAEPVQVDVPCPRCGNLTLRVETKLTARDIGTFSVAGQQLKFSANWVPWLLCGSCDFAEQGRFER